MYIKIVIYELIIKLVEYIKGIRTAQVIIHCFQYILNLRIFTNSQQGRYGSW